MLAPAHNGCLCAARNWYQSLLGAFPLKDEEGLPDAQRPACQADKLRRPKAGAVKQLEQC